MSLEEERHCKDELQVSKIYRQREKEMERKGERYY